MFHTCFPLLRRYSPKDQGWCAYQNSSFPPITCRLKTIFSQGAFVCVSERMSSSAVAWCEKCVTCSQLLSRPWSNRPQLSPLCIVTAYCYSVSVHIPGTKSVVSCVVALCLYWTNCVVWGKRRLTPLSTCPPWLGPDSKYCWIESCIGRMIKVRLLLCGRVQVCSVPKCNLGKVILEPMLVSSFPNYLIMGN